MGPPGRAGKSYLRGEQTMFRDLWSIPIFEKDGFPKKGPLLSFHWGVMQNRAAWLNDQTGSSSGMHDFSVVRKVDNQTPILFTACVKGVTIPTIFVYLEEIKGTTVLTFATYTFEGCNILTMGPAGREGGARLEEVMVRFGKSRTEYKKD